MRYLVILVTMFLVAGCAKSPQQVSYKPGVLTNSSLQGNGITFDLSFIDGRSSEILGSRGGAYEDTSLISLDSNALGNIEGHIQSRLVLSGYNMGDTSVSSMWTVKLEELTYNVTEISSIKDMLNVTAKMSVVIVKGNSTYTNSYSSKSGEEIVGLASETKNETAINRALNSAIDALFRDQGINDFLN